jgi:microcystin-dependent protein
MSSPFVAEIRMVPFNFPPTGWAFCAGQLLPISQNTALFSLLGTFYGGDGKSTFALPDLQDNVPISQGHSTTGTDYSIGEQSGVPYVTLISTEMPIHNHNYTCHSADPADNTAPGPTLSFATSSNGNAYVTGVAPNVNFDLQHLGFTGGSQPHNNMMPYLVMNYVIAMQGIYPARN